MSSVSFSPVPAPTLTGTSKSTPTPKTKRQEDQYEGLTRDSDDDNISLAKCMTRKLQSNQQMYPWMSPGLVALHQQHDSPASRDSVYAINKYSYTQYHQIQLQLQLQYQQQLMLHYQQQQQQQNLIGFNGPSVGSYHRQHNHHSQQRNTGVKQQSIVRKSKSVRLDDADHDLQTRMSSSTTSTHRASCSFFDNSAFSSTNTSKRNSRHHRLSLLSLPSDSMTQNHHSQHGYRQEKNRQQQQQQEMSSSAKHGVTRRSSIYSHASATSTSTAPATNNAANTIPSPGSNSKPQSHSSKSSLSKRLREVILGRNTSSSQQTHTTTSSSAPSSLRRSSSVASGTSSVTDNGCNSSRSLWTTLLRKSSRSEPANYDVEKQFVHGKRSSGRKDVVPDSPASSVSGGSYHRSFLPHGENRFANDLPSPASSTSPESPFSQPIDQLDYFDQSSQQAKTGPYTFLQQGSPRLQPSSNHHHHHHHQNRTSLVVSESDDLPAACFLATSIPSHDSKLSPAIALLPPISSPSASPSSSPSPSTSLSSSASTSTSSLALNHQKNDNNSTKLATKSISTKSDTRIQFSTTIQVYDTFGSQDYDRRCDTQVTCQRLTTILALQIKKELNEYKLNEMQVHLQSRQNTQFFL